ncbi:MAG TPA: hypothetical protein VN688_01025 [Gemmataceae bacterium]|nr:hypothetical protein [Gemmataceae bacterium]
MNATTTLWIGWSRLHPRDPWRRVVEAGDATEALNKLLDAVSGGDKTVLPAGIDPNLTPPAMRRRCF